MYQENDIQPRTQSVYEMNLCISYLEILIINYLDC